MSQHVCQLDVEFFRDDPSCVVTEKSALVDFNLPHPEVIPNGLHRFGLAKWPSGSNLPLCKLESWTHLPKWTFLFGRRFSISTFFFKKDIAPWPCFFAMALAELWRFEAPPGGRVQVTADGFGVLLRQEGPGKVYPLAPQVRYLKLLIISWLTIANKNKNKHIVGGCQFSFQSKLQW